MGAPEEAAELLLATDGKPELKQAHAAADQHALKLRRLAHEALDLPFTMAFGDTIMLEKGTWLEAAAPVFKALGHKEIIVRDAPIKGNAISRGPNGWISARDPRIERSLAVP